MVAFARTFGCPFCWELATQLRRDIKPQLDARGIRLFLVAIGTYERSQDFVQAGRRPLGRLCPSRRRRRRATAPLLPARAR